MIHSNMQPVQEGIPSSSDNADDQNDAAADGSYWEADKESSLRGKTLSTLDLVALESNHPEKQQEKKDNYWEEMPEKCLQGKTLSSEDMIKRVPKPIPITAEEPDAPPSYWDAPKESGLKGKTLSSLDMTALESNHPDEQQEKKDDYWGGTPKEESLKGRTLSTLDLSSLESNHPEELQAKKDSYWEADHEDTLKGKTLSTLSMSQLQANHPEEKKEKSDSYWDAPVEGKLQGKTLSTINMTTLECTEPSDASTNVTVESSGGASYWDEAPIDKSLQGKNLSKLDMAAMDKQHVDEKPPETPYWDWKVKAIRKTLSKISLSNLRSGSASDAVLDDDDCVHGGTNGGVPNIEKSPGVKPITKKKHKLRDSWRKSFQRLSTNTLSQMDDSSGSGTRQFGKGMFKSRNPLDWSSGSRGSQCSIDEDAIMF